MIPRMRVELMRDPENTQNCLELVNHRLLSKSGKEYELMDHFPVLVDLESITGDDKKFSEQYKNVASMYDIYSKFLFEMVGEDEQEARAYLTSLVEVSEGAKVLEVSAGTGLNIPHLREVVGSSGEIHALDLSREMLELACTKNLDHKNVFFYLANASYLPFPDESFDAVFHLGGINTFSDIPRALAEFHRVVKKGGKVVVIDEGMQPNIRETEYGRTALMTNQLYAAQPPLEHIPTTARELRLSWVGGGIFYVLEYVKGDPFVLNREVKVPGENRTLGEYLDDLTANS